MKTSTLLRRMFVLALAMTLVLPLLPALAEEDAGNAPQNPAVILAANPTTGYTWTVEIADEAVVSVTDDGIVQGDEQPLTGAGGLQRLSCSARRRATPPLPSSTHVRGRGRKSPCISWCTTCRWMPT